MIFSDCRVQLDFIAAKVYLSWGKISTKKLISNLGTKAEEKKQRLVRKPCSLLGGWTKGNRGGGWTVSTGQGRLVPEKEKHWTRGKREKQKQSHLIG